MGEVLPGVLPGVVAVLLGGAVLAAGEALLDARRTAGPWRVALLAPIADAARVLRRGAALPTVAVPLAAGVLVVGLGVVALPALVVALLGPPVVSAAWTGARAAVLRAAAVQAPAVIALLAPLIAAGGPGTGAALRSQDALWGAVAMPGTTALVLAAALTAVRRGPFRRAGGPVPASRVLLVGTAAAVSVLLLGGGAGPAPVPPAVWLGLKTAAVTALLVAVDRALPALSPDAACRIAVRFGLPLAALQVALAVLVALAAR